MKELTDRQLRIMQSLDGEEWRALESADARMAGRLCWEFRPNGPKFLARYHDPEINRNKYRLTPDGVARLKFEANRKRL